jgi:hypothetical protein
MEEHQQIPLWFFIGALLLIYGLLIAGSGAYYWKFPDALSHKPVLWDLHADFWWGVLLTFIGAIYCLRFNPMWQKNK